MRILALVPGGIGDQVLFFPTLEDLKGVYPHARIDVVVEPRAKAAYQVCPYVDQVTPFDFKDRNSPAAWGNLLGIVRDRQYEAVLTLGRSWGVHFFLWLTGIPTRVGYGGGSGQLFLTHPVPLKTEQYAAHLYHDLLAGFGITTVCPDLKITVPRKDLDWAEAEQRRLGLGSGYILLHGGSSQLSRQKGIQKIYPAQKWATVIQGIQQRQPNQPIVVVQGPEDREFVVELVKACPEIKLTVPGDIGKLSAMIAGANLLLCTDSAPMHLGVALQVYTVALFGPTDPKKLLPSSPKFMAVKSPTDRIQEIEPETILAKVLGS